MIRKYLAVLFCLMIVAAFTPLPAFAADGDVSSADNPAVMTGYGMLDQSVNTPDAHTVYLGQDKDGAYPWRVVGFDGTGVAGANGKITLLAADDMDWTEFNPHNNQINTYGKSLLKDKIDSITDNFSREERDAIAARTLKSGEYDVDDTDCIAGEEVKNAPLWPLSTKEANDLEKWIRAHTTDVSDNTPHTWLRSPGYWENLNIGFICNNGWVNSFGELVDSKLGVRPAFYLKMDSLVLTSAADRGKISGEPGPDALQPVGVNKSKDKWKLTIKDDAHSLFTALAVDMSDESVKGEFFNACTGDNEYLSAVIVNEAGEVTYYGRIKELHPNISVLDTFDIDLTGKYTDTDKIYVFNEHVNGDQETDYSSDLMELVKDGKAVNPLNAEGKTVKISYKKLKKKTQTIALKKVVDLNQTQGEVSWLLAGVKPAKAKKRFSIDERTGKVTVKKGLKKGLYKVTVNLMAAGTENFHGAEGTLTFQVRVK